MKRIGILINDISFLYTHREYLPTLLKEKNLEVELYEFSFKNSLIIYHNLLKCDYIWAISPLTSLILAILPLPSKKKILTFSGFGTIGFFPNGLLKVIFKTLYFFNPNFTVTTQNHHDTRFFTCLNFKNVFNLGGNGIAPHDFRVNLSNLNIVFVGRLLRQKGIIDFFKIKSIIDNHFPDNNYLWKVYGEIDKKNPSSISESELLKAKSLGIIFLGKRSDILLEMSAAKLLIFPSYREGLPKTIIEALSVGLPTVGYNVPGVQDILSFERDDLLETEICNFKGLANKAITLLENDSLWLSLSKKSLLHFQVNYTKDKTIAKHVDFIDKIFKV
jgi:glycosyltransferase involved in cell wall biosynthesis